MNELHELKRALYPAASPETDELIAALTGDQSRSSSIVGESRRSDYSWLTLPGDQKLAEIKLMRAKVRDKIKRQEEARAQGAKRLRLLKWVAVVLFALFFAALLAWSIL